MITINLKTKTVTRHSDHQTWTFAETGRKNQLAGLCESFEEAAVSRVLTKGNYYPPMLDENEMRDIRHALECRRAKKAMKDALEKNPNLTSGQLAEIAAAANDDGE